MENNRQTRHLAKILVHLVQSLQECQAQLSTTSASKAINAAYISSIFLKYFIENAKTHNFGDLYLDIDEDETKPEELSKGKHIFIY